MHKWYEKICFHRFSPSSQRLLMIAFHALLHPLPL